MINLSKFNKTISISLLKISLLVFFLDALLLNNLPYLRLGCFNLFIMDILSVLMIFLVIAKIFIDRFQIKRYMILPLIFGILLMTSFVRGVNLFGVERATLAFRTSLYFYAILMLTLCFANVKQFTFHIIDTWRIVAWLLFGLMIIRWGLIAIGSMDGSRFIAAGGLPMRTLNSAQTLLLLQVVIFSIIFGKNYKKFRFPNLITPLFILAIILLQQRTVWGIALFTFVIFFFFRKKMRNSVFIMGMIFLLFLSLLLLIGGDNSIEASLRGSATNIDTFMWRLESWQQLLQPERFIKIYDYLIGQPFGTGFSRFVTNSSGDLYFVEYSPHNFYVFTLLTIGALGLITVLIIYSRTIVLLLRQNKNQVALAFALLLISQLLYSISYRPSFEQGFILGTAILLSRRGNIR